MKKIFGKVEEKLLLSWQLHRVLFIENIGTFDVNELWSKFLLRPFYSGVKRHLGQYAGLMGPRFVMNKLEKRKISSALNQPIMIGR